MPAVPHSSGHVFELHYCGVQVIVDVIWLAVLQFFASQTSLVFAERDLRQAGDIARRALNVHLAMGMFTNTMLRSECRI